MAAGKRAGRADRARRMIRATPTSNMSEPIPPRQSFARARRRQSNIRRDPHPIFADGKTPMPTLKSKFEQAVADSKKLPKRPDNQTLLQIYALYKQATMGDATGKRPGFTDLVGRAKWDAWKAVEGKSATRQCRPMST